MPDYVALLGRANVGGNNVAMAELRAAVAELFFTTDRSDPDALTAELETHLGQRLGFPVPTFLRTPDELAAVLAGDPFAGVAMTEGTRLMVIALGGTLPAGVEFPVHDEAKGFTVLGVHGERRRDAVVVLRLINGRPGNVIRWMEQRFGVTGTGRFAHTLAKILAAATTTPAP